MGIDDDDILVALDDQRVAHGVESAIADCKPDAVGDDLQVVGFGLDNFLGLLKAGGSKLAIIARAGSSAW